MKTMKTMNEFMSMELKDIDSADIDLGDGASIVIEAPEDEWSNMHDLHLYFEDGPDAAFELQVHHTALKWIVPAMAAEYHRRYHLAPERDKL